MPLWYDARMCTKLGKSSSSSRGNELVTVSGTVYSTTMGPFYVDPHGMVCIIRRRSRPSFSLRWRCWLCGLTWGRRQWLGQFVVANKRNKRRMDEEDPFRHNEAYKRNDDDFSSCKLRNVLLPGRQWRSIYVFFFLSHIFRRFFVLAVVTREQTFRLFCVSNIYGHLIMPCVKPMPAPIYSTLFLTYLTALVLQYTPFKIQNIVNKHLPRPIPTWLFYECSIVRLKPNWSESLFYPMPPVNLNSFLLSARYYKCLYRLNIRALMV